MSVGRQYIWRLEAATKEWLLEYVNCRGTSMTPAPITVRNIQSADEQRWRELFRGYRAFYKLAESEVAVSTVWSWLMEPSHEVRGLVAEIDGEIVAIAHFRRFARPSTGTVGLWLDDLFSAPGIRGGGAGRALIQRVAEIAGEEGCSVIRGITAEDNHQAQALYDKVGTRTHWVTYDGEPIVAGSQHYQH